ncbi:hypothetical protein Tco_0377972 [Tanacetum coccineum]
MTGLTASTDDPSSKQQETDIILFGFEESNPSVEELVLAIDGALCNHPTVFTPKVNHGDNALKPLSSDYDVTDMAKYVSKCKLMDVFVIHLVDKAQFTNGANLGNKNATHFASGSNVSKTNCTRKDKASGPNDSKKPIVIEENDRSHSSVASDDSEENDLDVDQEDTIDDVEVDMADFRKYTDENVEWVGCNEEEVEIPQPFVDKKVDLKDFDSEPKSDEEEFERKKIIEKVSQKAQARRWSNLH